MDQPSRSSSDEDVASILGLDPRMLASPSGAGSSYRQGWIRWTAGLLVLCGGICVLLLARTGDSVQKAPAPATPPGPAPRADVLAPSSQDGRPWSRASITGQAASVPVATKATPRGMDLERSSQARHPAAGEPLGELARVERRSPYPRGGRRLQLAATPPREDYAPLSREAASRDGSADKGVVRLHANDLERREADETIRLLRQR